MKVLHRCILPAGAAVVVTITSAVVVVTTVTHTCTHISLDKTNELYVTEVKQRTAASQLAPAAVLLLAEPMT